MASEYQYPGRSSAGPIEAQRRISTRTLTSTNLESIALELLFGQQSITGVSSGSQSAQIGDGTGVLAFVGTSSGAQLVQIGDGTGMVVAPAAPAYVEEEHLWGEWLDVRKLIEEKAHELVQIQAPVPLSGMGSGTQAGQTGEGFGHVMARISGASLGLQWKQSGRGAGGISMTAKNERELRELLLLEAA